MSKYQVIVGNIGTVYEGSDVACAKAAFEVYANASRDGIGRAAGEQVVIITDDHVTHEQRGAWDEE